MDCGGDCTALDSPGKLGLAASDRLATQAISGLQVSTTAEGQAVGLLRIASSLVTLAIMDAAPIQIDL